MPALDGLGAISEVKADPALSATDPLTGPGDRRRYDLKVKELPESRPPDTTVGAISLDIDHFKPVNDTKGHLVGDTLLTLPARRRHGCAAAPGTTTLWVRWSGQEFS